jgi:hypothetical protein
MTRNEELIEKYKRYIKKMEKQIETMTAQQALPLIAKVSVYKMVIIDLQGKISQLEVKLTFEAKTYGLLELATKDALKRFAHDTGKNETPVYYYTFTGDDYDNRLIRLVVTDSPRNMLYVTMPTDEEEVKKAWDYLVKLNSHLQFDEEFVRYHADDFIYNRATFKVGFRVIA